MKIKSFYFTFFLLLLVSLLASCDLSPASEHSANISTDSDHYLLVDTQNGLRLQLKGSLLNKNEYSVQLADLEFDSLNDLIETLLKDKFDDWQLDVIKAFPSDKDGVKIFDINNAPSISLPDGFVVTKVYWRGEYYSFLVNGEHGEQIYIRWLSEESLSEQKEESFNPIMFYPGSELLRQNIIDDNTIEYEFTTQTAQLRRIVYQIDPQTCVVETFRVSSVYPDIFASNEIPNKISVFREENGLCYMVEFFDLITKPDLESLMQFRLHGRIELESESINAQYTTPNEHHENESTTGPMPTEEPTLPSAIVEYTPQQDDSIISASPTDDSAKDYLEEQNRSNEVIQPQLSLKSNGKIVKPMSFIYSSETYMEDLKALNQ